MLKIKFYESAIDSFLNYAVIIARYQNQWVLCQHKERDTYEIPGGHREVGESILDAAKRELYEETGAIKYTIKQLTPYSVLNNGVESFGMIFYAQIESFGPMPDLEIEKICMFDNIPDNLTYPTLHPFMIEKYNNMIKNKK